MLIPRVKRTASVLRTALRRRGLGYASHLIKEHALPRAAYHALLGPSQSGALARALDAGFAARDVLTIDACLRRARALQRPPGAGRAERVVVARVRTDDFAHEWLALAWLRDTGRVPTVIGADERRRELTLEAMPGTPLRAPLAAADQLALEQAFNALHRLGGVGLRFALDELRRLPGGSIAFGALPGVRLLRPSGIRFQIERDRDRAAANAHVGTSMLTEASARAALEAVRAQLPPGWFQDYAPIDFGAGLSVGRFPVTDSGTGRWEVFNSRVVAPLVAGQRVLDLGSNNGSLPLMMLRAGASEVVAVERSPLLAEAARVHARVFEWRDMRSYALDVRVGDMRDVLRADWGRFDVVTAFCSLYYLPEEDMGAIMRYAARMGATLVLQSNEAAENIPASRAARLRRLMEQHGYPSVAVHEFAGFARPILVGTPEPRLAQAFA